MWCLPFIYQGVAVVGELQEVRDLIARLKADNDRPRQDQALAPSGPSTMPSTSAVPATAQFHCQCPVFVPQDRNCPIFRGSNRCRVSWEDLGSGRFAVRSGTLLVWRPWGRESHGVSKTSAHPVACRTPRHLCTSDLLSMLLTVPSGSALRCELHWICSFYCYA